MIRRCTAVISVAILLMTLGGARVAAGQSPARPEAPAVREPLPAAEVQRLFDAYALSQAQKALQLTDVQYERFVPRMKTLHGARRRHMRQRMLALRELARLTRPGRAVQESRLRERLRALEDHDRKAAAELERAYAGIDEVLDLRQQARFRVFEQNIERQKFELLMRARQRRPHQGRRP